MSVRCVIVAAGMGTRLGAPVPKALLDVEGQPLLVRTLRRMQESEAFGAPPVVTYPEAHRDDFERCLADAGLTAALIPGGAERQDSVRIALQSMDPDTELVAIHDAARPFVPVSSILASLDAARECGAATVAIPVTDTILEADGNAFLVNTPDRARMWACQTPQTFRYRVIMEAHQRAAAESFLGTDDASLVRRYGGAVKLVMGHTFNIKITRPEDLRLARAIIQED